MDAIATSGLTKDFGAGRGVFDLDLRVPAGRVHGFLGPNGAGKTTTIRVLMDYLRPTRGTATVLGLDARREATALRRRIGYVPGDLALPQQMTGARYLEDSARLHGNVDPSWQGALIERFGARTDEKIRRLSKGNKQKLVLVDALQHRPELLILDEPTDGLDPVLREEVRRLLREHVARGGTVFLSSHVVHEIQTMCDDVTILLDGRLRHQARIADLLAREPVRVQCRVPDMPAALARLAKAPVRRVQHRGDQVRFEVVGQLLPVVATLLACRATDLRVRQGDLEETFLRLYGGGKA